jgi:heat shock protein HslJ
MKSTLSLVLTLTFLFGCAQIASQTPPERVEGTSWQLMRFQSSDGTVLAPDDRAKYTIAFADDSSLSVRFDCNRGRGTWESAGAGQRK